VRRRDFIKGIVGTAVALPIAARAQQTERMRLIGVLMGYAESDPVAQSLVAALRAGLTKLGWTEGSNFRIELRWSAGDADRMKRFAKELVDLRPDVILGQTTPAVEALARETRTIPVVFVNVNDPLASGFVASFAYPGGNITGFSILSSEQGGKWVELLKEIAPRTLRMALLFNPATGVPLENFMPSIQAAASSFAVEVRVAPVRTRDEIETVIVAQARDPGGGLIVLPSAFSIANRDQIIALAARYRVPTIYYQRRYTESGGLITYGPDFAEQFRQAPDYINRILKGAKPADLPVQAPTKYELVINLKTAKALALTVPPLLLSRADEVIE
jgi:putative tryptophan/tyrosine transport system substrate-binding protein